MEEKMKRKLSLFILIVVLACLFCGCPDSTEDQGNGSVNGGSTSNLGDYNVVISSCRLAEDYEGAPVVIVKYLFTNNSDEAEAFMWAISENVYQAGVGLNEAYFLDDSANYSADNQSKEIMQGVTLAVEVAYKLNDTTTPIDVECKELISFSNKKITKRFTL